MKKLLLLLIIPVTLLFNKPQIKQQQEADSLNSTDLPPTLHLTVVALGPLKGLISNILWMQADDKQQAKEFYETMQYCRWISLIQPHQEDIWRYIGWNISYNIAGNYTELDEKWQWIQKGIKLMRNEGLRYNPNSEIIGYEISETYGFKIGFGETTTEGQFYQRKFFDQMTKYFDNSDAEYIKNLSESARNIQSLTKIAAVQELISNQPELLKKTLSRKDAQASQGLKHIYFFQKRKLIEKDLHMKIDQIQRLNSETGGLDWRLYHAHSLYFICPEGVGKKMTQTGLAAMRSKSLLIQALCKGKVTSISKSKITTSVNEKLFDIVDDVLKIYREEDTYRIVSTLEFLIPIAYRYKNAMEARLLYQEYVRRLQKKRFKNPKLGAPKSWGELIKDQAGSGVLLN